MKVFLDYIIAYVSADTKILGKIRINQKCYKRSACQLIRDAPLLSVHWLENILKTIIEIYIFFNLFIQNTWRVGAYISDIS